MIAFHRGISSQLRMKLQMAGIRADESSIQSFYKGQAPFRGTVARVGYDLADEVFDARFELMKEWEEANPDQNPYPPIFAEVVLAELRGIDPSDPGPTIQKLIALAEEELAFG